MADMNSISHSVICVDDLHAAHEFYEDVMGTKRTSSVCFETEDTLRGRSVHDTYIISQDFVFFVALSEKKLPKPPADQHRGLDGFRSAFFVPKEQFDKTVTALKERGIGFEGPVDHPEKGPFGQSVYFKDPSGNFFECLWRRDEGTPAFEKPYFLGLG
jgi:catechol-2,3-dioxygenase